MKKIRKIRIVGFTALPLLTFACTSPGNITDPDIIDDDPDDKDPPVVNPIPSENVNVLFIMTDQQSYHMISEVSRNLGTDQYANNPFLNTPNLDKLVKKGYTFANAYAAHPVSVPSRFAMLTGESPNQYGQTGNNTGGDTGQSTMIKQRAMGNLFKNAGFRTFYGGKVHLPWANNRRAVNDPPIHYGFDEYLTDNDREILAQKGAEFFSTYDSEDPFLLFLSFMNPHDISMTQLLWGNQTLEDYAGLGPMEYRARVNQLSWRPTFQAIPASNFQGDGILATLPANYAPTDKFPIKDFNITFNFNVQRMRTHIWFYNRLVEQVDAEIGQVLDALESSPYKDNTVIIFTSDHGEMAGAHNLQGKNIPYQESQKVPLIFVGSGVQEHVVDITTPVSNGWDMLPTILDLMDIEKPDELHGISLYDKITRNKELDRKYLYYETVNSHGVLEDGRYKYTHFVERNPYSLHPGQNESLFDLQTDPGELRNLVDDVSFTAKLIQLRSALAAEMAIRGMSYPQ